MAFAKLGALHVLVLVLTGMLACPSSHLSASLHAEHGQHPVR
jgi:hypothetical protein